MYVLEYRRECSRGVRGSGIHDCTGPLTSRWTPQFSFGGGEHAPQHQKQKLRDSVEHTPAPVNCAATTPCPPTDLMALVNRPASTFPVVTCFPLSSWYGSRAGPIKLALFPAPGQEFSGSAIFTQSYLIPVICSDWTQADVSIPSLGK